MISKECFTSEWINNVSESLGYNDKNLIEKVIRALSLLEMLVQSGCPLVFKGGTALMLILGKSAHRLSIDIDVICPPGTNIEEYLTSFKDFGFIDFELVERKQRGTDIPKSHSKFFYQIAYRDNKSDSSHILLDVLYEDIHYRNTNLIDINCPFIKLDGEPLKVTVPSADDILGDKLTAFAPNTTGIPYYKEDKCCSMEIAKQLYDIGRLFDFISGDLSVTTDAFRRIAEVELSYRGLQNDLTQIYNDIRQTSLCIATRGFIEKEHFDLMQNGIIRVKSFMYKEKYYIENAIVDCAKASYLATSIEKGNTNIARFSGSAEEVKDMIIQDTLPSKLNKLKITLPEAFYYWSMTSELLRE